MTYNDFGTPTDTLAAPSLSEWAAAVAAELDSIPARVGGVLHASASVPSAISGYNSLGVVGSPTTWGGMVDSSAILTVPVAGFYQVTVNGFFGSSAAGTVRTLWAATTGNVPPAGQYTIGAYGPPISTSASSGLGALLAASGVWSLTAGASVYLLARQDSGASLTVSATLSVQLVH